MIETKQIRLSYYSGRKPWDASTFRSPERYINDLTAFGWQKTEEVTQRHSRHSTHYQIMARETNMANYNMLKSYENEYEEAASRLKSYDEPEGFAVLILFLLFIIPGILYLVHKNNQKIEITARNRKYDYLMKETVEKARKVC